MSKRHIFRCAMGLLLMLGAVRSFAQTPSRADQVKAVFLFNFTRFVDWPPASLGAAGEPFVIGVLGPNPFGAYLKAVVSGESVGSHPILVKEFSTAASVSDCHILFINTTAVAPVVRLLHNRSILTVGNQDNFATSGGIIRFFIQNNKIKLQINLKAAREANLSISSKLLRIADVINE